MTPPITVNNSDSFSQLTLFLFASALGLFVALLGWSDQIRGIDKDTKELESRFLQETGISKRDFLCVVKPARAGEELAVLTRLMTTLRIKSHTKVNLLSTFKNWNKEWSHLERLTRYKYYFVIALTLAFFVAGVISLFTHSNDVIRFHFFNLRTEMCVLTLPMTLIVVLLGIMLRAAQREKALRAVVDLIANEVD